MGTVVPLGAIRGPGIAVVKRTGERIPISHAFIPSREARRGRWARAGDVRGVPGARRGRWARGGARSDDRQDKRVDRQDKRVGDSASRACEAAVTAGREYSQGSALTRPRLSGRRAAY